MTSLLLKLSPLVVQKREYVKGKISEDQVTVTLDHFGNNGDWWLQNCGLSWLFLTVLRCLKIWTYVLSCFSRVWLCHPLDCSLPGSSVHGISQERVLDWLPFPPPGDLPDPGTKPTSLPSPALAGWFFTTSATWEAQCVKCRGHIGRVECWSHCKKENHKACMVKGMSIICGCRADMAEDKAQGLTLKVAKLWHQLNMQS